MIAPAESRAFTLLLNSGKVTARWRNDTFKFDVDARCDSYSIAVRNAIGAAADLWGAVPTSSLQIVTGSRVTLPAAITTYVGSGATQYAPTSNAIVSANVTTMSSTLANAVLAHEIGHSLGFGHSADANALMYYATGTGRQAVLAKDDIGAPRRDDDRAAAAGLAVPFASGSLRAPKFRALRRAKLRYAN